MKTFKTPKGTELPLISLKGKDYLTVPYRVLWFREDKPDWRIETEFVHLTDESATAKATIKDQNGFIMATAHKQESKKAFADNIEKSETGAIGRALALIGYGTQFATELEEGDRIVDAPQQHTGNAYSDHAVDDHVINFGKFKGKRFEEIPNQELESYIAFIRNKYAKENKFIDAWMVKFIDSVENYLSKPKK